VVLPQIARRLTRDGGTGRAIVERRTSKPLTAGEGARDESLVGEETLKVAMFVPVLDQLTMQLKERFGDEQVGLVKEIALFASGGLKSGAAIRPTDTKNPTST